MLINPPQKYYEESLGFNTYFPIGLLSIAASIRHVCDVQIFDCLIEDFHIQKTDNYTFYGTPLDTIKKRIAEVNPDIVGISIPFSAQSQNAIEVAKLCKDTIVVFGGPHASVRYNSLLDFGDYCVIGEGETTFLDFIETYRSHGNLSQVKGIACKRNGEIIFTPRPGLKDLDSLPIPSYDLVDIDAYLQNPYLYKSRSLIREHSISMITSRGCPFNCIFCSIKLHMGNIYRAHSVDYVIKHMKYCIEHLGIKKFHFEDDNISLNKQRFEGILDRIIEEKLDIQWDTPNGVRADTLDFGILKKIKKSGCKSLRIAIESGSERVLNHIIRKNTSLDYAINVIEWCHELDIRVAGFYVIGFPGETLDDIQETVGLALGLYMMYKVVPILLFATPLYGTELYDICLEKGLISADITDEEIGRATQFYGTPLISTDDFTKDDLMGIAANFEKQMDKLGVGGIRKILTNQESLFN